jgi:hypothetical protein
VIDKTKKLAVNTILLLYCMGLVLAAFSFFIDHYQILRQKHQIDAAPVIKTLYLSDTDWNKFEDKHEIFYANHYYDVISHQKINNTHLLKAVLDSTENHFRVIVNQVFKKHKKPIDYKKNNFQFAKHLVDKNQMEVCKNTTPLYYISPNFDNNFNQKTKNYICILENPPC